MSMRPIKKIIQSFQTAPDFLSGLRGVIANLVADFQADAGAIYLIDESHGVYVLMAGIGHDEDLIGKVKIKLGEGLVGLVGEREEVINLTQAQAHPSYKPHSQLKDKQYASFIGAPMMQQGELLGIVVLQHIHEREFTEEEEASLVTISAQLAGVIGEARARGAVQEFMEKVRRGKKVVDTFVSGLPGAGGIAIGRAVVVFLAADLEAIPDQEAQNIEAEINLFENALMKAREEIHELQLKARNKLSVAENALFEAYSRILDSRSLMSEVESEIEKGQWAQGALKRVIKKHILHFESLDDPYLQERASDFRDLGRRILAHMQEGQDTKPEYPKNTILVSEEVTPSLLFEVPDGALAGIVSGSGSGSSHVAILARAMGVPTVMGLTGTPINQLAGKELIVDGYNGQVYLSPSTALKKEFKSLLAEEVQLDAELVSLRDLPAETQDEHRVALYINTGLAVEVGLSLSVGAEGIGLYRTELPFMLRDRFPSEEEQRIMYRQLLHTFAPRPVVMRTLDVGGDKQLSYFPVEEENPFLGWRGIRISLDHPEIFIQQIRAMLHASEGLNNLSLLLPMISTVNEVEESQRLIKQAHKELLEEGINVKLPKLGLMVEVPAAVYQAYELAKRVDFLSVGTNDLIQYLLAVDRNNARVANLYNGLHPAVLRALADIVKASHRANKPVSVCGELASDPVAVVLLLGMGFDALSMNARALPRVKWVVRNFTIKRARQLVKEVLKMDDPMEVRGHLELALEEAGLGGLIRAGKM
jgi:phosphotransferase system enzyme I (PtsP)